MEHKLPLAIVLWNNDGLAQIRDGMKVRGIPPIGVNQLTPDDQAVARGFGCLTAKPGSLTDFEAALAAAFAADRPTVIELREDSPFLS